MTSYEFEVAAKNAVTQFIQEKHGETYGIREILILSMTDILGNKRAVMVDCGANHRYYEVTYGQAADLLWVDELDLVASQVGIPSAKLDFTVHQE